MGNLDNKNRVKGEYFVLKQPSIFVAENRGFSNCCEPFLTLVDPNDNASHRNDTNSAWSLGETVTFELKKGGVTTSYIPVAIPFPNETNAWYTTIEWRDVQFMDGYGVFELYMTVVSAGLTVTTLWAKYNVQPYQNASGYYLGKGTVRLKSIFNDVNTFEGINFTNAYVVDTLRLKGKFGYWNPLTDVDNVQYTDAEKIKVRREDLTEYELRVDLHGECVIDRLRFHLVSENACYITDHNGDNYTYKYLDYPVIVKSGFEPNWIDGTRKVKGVAKFEDKQKMTKTHFQDNDTNGKFNEPQKIALPATINDNGVIVYVPGGQYYETGSVIKDLYYKLLKDTFKGRVTFDSGTFEAESCLVTKSEEIGIDLLESASLIITPNGTKASKLYSVVPSDGSGDMTVTRATTATRVNSSGLIESVASNVPRLDYSNGSCPSILVEPQRTNLLRYSEDFTNGVWALYSSGTGVNPVITANTTTSPSGVTNADTIVLNAGAGTTAAEQSQLYQTFSITNGNVYTFSFYAKGSVGGEQLMIRHAAGSSYSKITLTDEWERYEITETASYTGTGFLELLIRRGLNEPINASCTFYAWGAQLEAGSYATSYIPTTSASVTRNADVINKTGISSLIGQTEGTLFLDFYYDGSAYNHMIIREPGYSTFIYFNSQNANELWGQIQNAGIQFSMSATAGRYKMALAYKSGSSALYINGTQIGTSSTTFSVVGTISELDYTLSTPNNKINASALWKTRLTNTQLAQLTTI